MSKFFDLHRHDEHSFFDGFGKPQELVEIAKINRIGGGQTLITCCEDARIAERTGGRVLTVENGVIR